MVHERSSSGLLVALACLLPNLLGGCAGGLAGPAQPASLFRPTPPEAADAAAGRGMCPMVGLTAGEQKVRLTLEGDVVFDTDRHDLKPAAVAGLAKIKASFINTHPGARVSVEGHTDDRGSVDYNLALSDRRAGSVASWFEQNGIAGDRVARRGYGKAFPKVPNVSDANRAKNRRVEIVVAWGNEASPAAVAPSCPGVQACCDLGSPAGCLGSSLGPDGWGGDLSIHGMEDTQGALRLNPCRATRSPAVWITSTDENKVARLDEQDGKEVFRVPTWGRFPQRTAVAADGSVWITNRNSGSYVHLAPDGKLLCSSPYKTCLTRAAAIDSQGFAWIGCHDKKELIQVDPSRVEGTTEVSGEGDQKVNAPMCKEVGRVKLEHSAPYGLAADRSGGMWTGADQGEISKIDTAARRVVLEINPKDDPKLEGCWEPYGITIDRDGNPWYANRGCKNVVKLDSRTGRVTGAFKGGPEGLRGPRALGADPRGHIWVSESSSHFVDELTSDGTFVRRVDTQPCAGGSSPLGVASDSEGDIWVALQSPGKAVQFRSDGTFLTCAPTNAPPLKNAYTYSDFTGASQQMAGSEIGKTRVQMEQSAIVRWKLLSFRAVTPPGTSLCLRARAADSKQSLVAASWGDADCPRAAAWTPTRMSLGQGLVGKVLEVELELSSSDPASTPMISDLTAAAIPAGK
ncbi:MAG: OmpA family protein [Deltaproteobacteria bacterium]|nr:OmpA family protein [Deltaproteobacteria bacterium]